MPSYNPNFYSYQIGPENKKPVAIIDPGSQENSLGSIIRMDARQSFDPEDGAITYRWSFVEVPAGSKVREEHLSEQSPGFLPLESNNSVVTFFPDKVGFYRVQLIVNDGIQDSDATESLTTIRLSLVPVCQDNTPDARWIWEHLSDFWSKMQNRDHYGNMWSAMVQAVAAETLALYQVDYAKSIRDIQEYFQRKWMNYTARWDFDDNESPFFILGNQDCGINGELGDFSLSGQAVLVGPREIYFVQGSVNSKYIGQTLTINDSIAAPPNTGTYVISGIASGGASYVVSAQPGFPNYIGETIHTAADVEATSGSDVITFPSGGLLALTITAGDILRLSGTESDIGYYLIEAVLTDLTLRVNRPTTQTATGRTGDILNNVNVVVNAVPDTYTDVLKVPLAETPAQTEDPDYANFETLNESSIRGTGTIVGTREILVPEWLVFEDAEQRKLVVRGGDNGGEYTISGLNPAKNGYFCTAARFQGPFPDSDVPITIEGVRAASGRVIVIGGKGLTLSRVDNDSVLRQEPKSVAIVREKRLPSGMSLVKWRLPATLATETDLEKEGVRPGDRLVFDIVRLDTGAAVEFPTTVVGVDANRVGFELTVEQLLDEEIGVPTDEEIVSVLDGLGVTGVVTTQAGIEYTGDAQKLGNYIASSLFSNQVFNSPITTTRVVDVGLFTVTISPSYIIRNSLIPVDSDLASVPCVCDYIKEPVLSGSEADGDLQQILDNDEVVDLEQEPVCFRENSDYVIEADLDIFGTNANVVGGSTTIELPYADLISRRVEVLDTLTLLDGPSADDYTIVNILDEDKVLVVPAPPETSIARYVVQRRVPGKFMRFYGYYTPKLPAPEQLWGEVSFFSNTQSIEDNFGYMVALTAEDLEDIDSQLPYKSAVTGLMYAWALGPSMNRVELGSQILLGFPYAEHPGTIIDIRDDYRTDDDDIPITGRILILEDSDSEFQAGVTRAYFYPPLVTATDPSTGEVYPLTDPETSGLADNPETGAPWAVGDRADQFSILTKGVRVRDYVDDPTWFVLSGTTIIAEPEKMHTFEVRANSGAIDSRDAHFVSTFINAIKPEWTKALFNLSQWFHDEVIVEDDFVLDLEPQLYDTPGFGIEACLRADNYNESGVLNAPLDLDSLVSLTPEVSWDLVTTDGSLVVTSATGGFINELSWRRHGVPLVRPGDLLFIREGPNAGTYVIETVPSDGSLQLYLGADYTNGRPQDHLVTATAQAFQVMRRVTHMPANPPVSVQFTLGDAFVDLVTPAEMDFFSMGVTADDVMICQSGSNRGVYRILSIAQSGALAGQWDRLNIEPLDFPGNPGWAAVTEQNPIIVVREVLLANPIRLFEAPTFHVAESYVDVGTGNDGLETIPVRLRDELWQMLAPAAGSNPPVMGKRFTVTGIDYTTGRATVNPPPLAADVGAQPDMYLVRPEHRWGNYWWNHLVALRTSPLPPQDRHELDRYTSDVDFSKVLRDLPQDQIELILAPWAGHATPVTLTLNSGAADIVELVGLAAGSGAGTVDALGIELGDLVDVLSGAQTAKSPLVVIGFVAGGGNEKKLVVNDNTLVNEVGLDFTITRVKR